MYNTNPRPNGRGFVLSMNGIFYFGIIPLRTVIAIYVGVRIVRPYNGNRTSRDNTVLLYSGDVRVFMLSRCVAFSFAAANNKF